MVHRIELDIDEPRQITQAVVQITELLNMYRADLARVLSLKCGDIGELVSGKTVLSRNAFPWQAAHLFVEFYNLLYDKFNGDGPAMCHWFRSEHSEMDKTPFDEIVDKNSLGKVVRSLQTKHAG